MKQLVTLIVVAGSLFAHSQTTQKNQAGEIRGTVIDQNFIPVSGATVYAVPQGLALNEVTPRSVKADRNGVFDFHGKLPLGAYKLYAEKDADAYPDPLDGFYADAKNEAAKVELTENRPSAAVTVRLGAQAGVVSGRVIGAGTGKDLKALLAFITVTINVTSFPGGTRMW